MGESEENLAEDVRRIAPCLGCGRNFSYRINFGINKWEMGQKMMLITESGEKILT